MASRIKNCRNHFRYRLSQRFKIKRADARGIEETLMQRLFLGTLNFLKEDMDTIKVWFPELHRKCVVIFDKQKNVFITGYKRNNIKYSI